MLVVLSTGAAVDTTKICAVYHHSTDWSRIMFVGSNNFLTISLPVDEVIKQIKEAEASERQELRRDLQRMRAGDQDDVPANDRDL